MPHIDDIKAVPIPPSNFPILSFIVSALSIIKLDTPFIKCSGGNSCPEIVQGKFTHFVSRKAMDIDGLGQEILYMLIKNKFINDYSDIFTLKNFLSELESLERFGKKSVDNLIKVCLSILT